MPTLFLQQIPIMCAPHPCRHRFYQHLPGPASEWDFGIVWGHAHSPDLVQWEHEEIALKPTPEGLDSAGCFSGCAAVDSDGSVVLLYTGVRLRQGAMDLPPPDQDLNLAYIESQLAAVAGELSLPLTFHSVSIGLGLRLCPYRPWPPPVVMN